MPTNHETPQFDDLPVEERLPRLLRAARQLGGFASAARLAAAIREPGYGERAIAVLESGDRAPTFDELRTISRACGVDVSHFYRSHGALDEVWRRIRTAREIADLEPEDLAERIAEAEAQERGVTNRYDEEQWLESLRAWESGPDEDGMYFVPNSDDYRYLARALSIPERLLHPISREAREQARRELSAVRVRLAEEEQALKKERERLVADRDHDREIAVRSMEIARNAEARLRAAESQGDADALRVAIDAAGTRVQYFDLHSQVAAYFVRVSRSKRDREQWRSRLRQVESQRAEWVDNMQLLRQRLASMRDDLRDAHRVLGRQSLFDVEDTELPPLPVLDLDAPDPSRPRRRRALDEEDLGPA